MRVHFWVYFFILLLFSSPVLNDIRLYRSFRNVEVGVGSSEVRQLNVNSKFWRFPLNGEMEILGLACPVYYFGLSSIGLSSI